MPIFSPEELARHAAIYQAQQAAPQSSTSTPDRSYQRIGRPSVWGGNLADLASTEWALGQGNVHEANPVLGDRRSMRILGKLGAAAGEDFMLSKLAKAHPKLAAGFGAAIGALDGVIAARNVRTGLRARDAKD